MNHETAEVFQKLGLTKYQASALAIIIKEPGTTALNVSEKAEVPYTKVYAVIDSLRAMNFVKAGLERPKKYHAANPDQIIDFLVKRQEDTLFHLRECAFNARTLLKQQEMALQAAP